MTSSKACCTQEEIAEKEGLSKAEVNNVCSEMAELPNVNKPIAEHLVDFDPPLYNIWKQHEKTLCLRTFLLCQSHFKNEKGHPLKGTCQEKKVFLQQESMFFSFRPPRKLLAAYPVAARYSSRGCEKDLSERSFEQPQSPSVSSSGEALRPFRNRLSYRSTYDSDTVIHFSSFAVVSLGLSMSVS